VTLTRGITMSRDITMPRGIGNATCHTHELDTWHFIFIFKFFKKRFKKFKEKLKKKTKKNHILTRGTLTNGVSQLCLKGT